MENTNPNSSPSRFEILFEKLDEAKTQQSLAFSSELETTAETNKIIALFKEYQASGFASTYNTYTRS